MVALSDQVLPENLSLVKACKPTSSFFNGIPVIDLSSPEAKTLVVEACREFGFFKVINHGVPAEFMTRLEAEAVNFFNQSQSQKDKAGPPNPFGYGSRKVGPNGDVGWIEYLLFSTKPELISQTPLFLAPENFEIFRSALSDYVPAVKNMLCEVLELMADGLRIGPRNVLSRLLRDENSDSCFRLNHYPPCPDFQASNGRNLIGFGEHTDPQIVAAVRSNNTSGLQISLRDGTWVSVPPDQFSFFINVGDSLQSVSCFHRFVQVMTHGRFRSVRHRVFTDNWKSRLSMIYLAGPPLSEKIVPLSSLMEEGEESLYKEFTWCEYKQSASKTRLGDNRLGLFEKAACQ